MSIEVLQQSFLYVMGKGLSDGLSCVHTNFVWFNSVLRQCADIQDTTFCVNLLFKVTFYIRIPYFFGYKMEFFSFQNNLKDLDPSCKTDLDLWDCLGRVKLVL